ncbi:hypothetical protein SZ25_00370 [Candidatus Arcanobacter lacustris]|uniref:Uncharacterized protein n=1 Tax=Candidatus Arcanibacter lacustris TaxID=1607817 RepID=A0A0F5MP38_9RICK|nr:hypothetical protein SZ25_00370 [Candidatus Arcanobacter lacustris]
MSKETNRENIFTRSLARADIVTSDQLDKARFYFLSHPDDPFLKRNSKRLAGLAINGIAFSGKQAVYSVRKTLAIPSSVYRLISSTNEKEFKKNSIAFACDLRDAAIATAAVFMGFASAPAPIALAFGNALGSVATLAAAHTAFMTTYQTLAITVNSPIGIAAQIPATAAKGAYFSWEADRDYLNKVKKDLIREKELLTKISDSKIDFRIRQELKKDLDEHRQTCRKTFADKIAQKVTESIEADTSPTRKAFRRNFNDFKKKLVDFISSGVEILTIKNPINQEMQNDIRATHKYDSSALKTIREEIKQNTDKKTIKEYKKKDKVLLNSVVSNFISGKTRETSDKKEKEILEDVKTKFDAIEEKSYKGEDVGKIYKGIGAEGIFQEGTGLVISEVYPGSPAEKMHLTNQDVITHFHNQDGKEVPITAKNIKEAISAIRQGNGFKTNDKEIKNITPEFINTKYKATHANVLTIKSDSDFKKELENIKPQENYKAQKIDKIKSKINSKSR